MCQAILLILLMFTVLAAAEFQPCSNHFLVTGKHLLDIKCAPK